MAPPPRPSFFKSRSSTAIKIIPDRSYILLEGSMAETRDAPFDVSGTVLVSTNESSNIKNGILVVLQGFRKTMHAWRKRSISDVVPQRIVNAEIFLRKQLELTDPETDEPVRKLKPGTRAYRYSFTLPGDISESIEGLPGQCVEYDLKAFAERPLLSSRLEAKYHLRIVRTLGTSMQDELLDRQETIGNWEGKCNYKFGTTSRAAIFGDHIGIDFSLTPHEAKVDVGKIEIILQEKQQVKTTRPPPEAFSAFPESQNGWWLCERLIDIQEFRCPPGSRRQDPETEVEKFQASFRFKLPPDLTRCRQTVENHPFINFKHALCYTIDIINADGHVSQLKAHHNVRIFISPHLPIGPRNEVQQISENHNPTLLESLQEAPPTYAHHTLDAVFHGVPYNGYQTPGSHSLTPLPLSRRPSTDILTHLSSPTPAPASHVAHAQDLSERLASLRDLGAAPPAQPTEDGSAETSPLASRSASMVASAERGYDMQALERLTSYNTAVRTPGSVSAESPPGYWTVSGRLA